MGVLPPLLLTAILAAAAPSAQAQAPRRATIEVELATDSDASPTDMQQWFEILRDLKVDNLRARTAGATDGPSVTATTNAGVPVYRVVGIVTRNSELILPSGRVPHDRARPTERLACPAASIWPDRRLGRRQGTVRDGQGAIRRLGADLARPVTFATKGMKPAEFLDQIADLVRQC